MMRKAQDSNELKIIHLENEFKKVVFIKENEEERRSRLKVESQNNFQNSNVENINNMKNNGSLFIKDFKIRYLSNENINKPQICSFKTFSGKINPFLSEQFVLSEKPFIDLKNIEDTEENFNNYFHFGY